MAADSLAVDNSGQIIEVAKLLSFDGGVLLGVAGRSASVPLLRHHLDPEPPVPGDEPDEWAQDLAWRATDLLVEAHITDPDDANEFHGVLLLAHGGAVWEIQTGVANRVRRSYHAVGSGDQVALGALWAIDGELPLEDQARLAVEAACEHMADVGGEVVVRST